MELTTAAEEAVLRSLIIISLCVNSVLSTLGDDEYYDDSDKYSFQPQTNFYRNQPSHNSQPIWHSDWSNRPRKPLEVLPRSYETKYRQDDAEDPQEGSYQRTPSQGNPNKNVQNDDPEPEARPFYSVPATQRENNEDVGAFGRSFQRGSSKDRWKGLHESKAGRLSVLNDPGVDTTEKSGDTYTDSLKPEQVIGGRSFEGSLNPNQSVPEGLDKVTGSTMSSSTISTTSENNRETDTTPNLSKTDTNESPSTEDNFTDIPEQQLSLPSSLNSSRKAFGRSFGKPMSNVQIIAPTTILIRETTETTLIANNFSPLASDAETSFSRQTTIKALPNDQSVISSPPALRGRTIVGVSNRTQSKTTSKAIHDTFEINEIPAVDAEVSSIDMSVFQNCTTSECNKMCGIRNKKYSWCDAQIQKLCMCAAQRFVSVGIEGRIVASSKSDPAHMSCGSACRLKSGYGRIHVLENGTTNCICLSHQKSRNGITLCDQFAVEDVCKDICQSSTAFCTLSGVCVCSESWAQVYNMTFPNIRQQVASDDMQCSRRCEVYHHDYVPRLYDSLIKDKNPKKTYPFGAKYCLCGPEATENRFSETLAMQASGFQICTGLKCKQRCAMKEAYCEPQYRRACMCPRQNLFIKPHLWSRLPSSGELMCEQTCKAYGLQARVIEKNPLLYPESERFLPYYRHSLFEYQYDGKFCHCLKMELDLSAFRPCVDELCRWLCGHHEATCDTITRRDCICNTHELIAGLGRKPDPGEGNCDAACRFHQLDSMVIDVRWDTKHMDGWGVSISKFCGCVRQVSAAGLHHCSGINDKCPKFCNNPKAFCTREKYCDCGITTQSLLKMVDKGPIRQPNGAEAEECGEVCRSWMWPVAEDSNRVPLIYDEERESCGARKDCTKVDTTPWKAPKLSGTLGRNSEMMKQISRTRGQRYCLCSKTVSTHYKPGTRFLPRMEPERAPTELECIGTHTCKVVGNSVHIVS